MGETPPGQAPARAPLVELVGITKTFGDLVANDAIDLAVAPGEVHALLGENGAGKSTLTRILYGLSRPDAGELRVDGSPIQLTGSADAMRAGVGLVTQEFSLVGPMTVTENLMLADVGLVRADRRTARERVVAASERLGVTIDPDAVVESLSVGERQRVEILKALYHDCRLLVLDEPTAVLVPDDVDRLFASIRRLTAQGMGVVFISHKLHEVVEIADRVSILRRGRLVASLPATGLDTRRIAALMVGADSGDALIETAAAETALGAEESDRSEGGGTREEGSETRNSVSRGSGTPVRRVEARQPTGGDSPLREAAGRPAALHIDSLSLERDGVRVLEGIDLEVVPGEIVGVAGVSGNGQTQLVEVLGGTTKPSTGRILVAGHDVTSSPVAERLAAGLGRLSEDRRGSVVPALSVEQNLVLEDLHRFRRGPLLDRRRVRAHARELIARFDIRAAPTDPVRSLSGGTMQKVLLARAIHRDPLALVASQPTRGLDVAACAYVYAQLRGLTERGAGVLLVSEDLDELLGVCDRIVVLFKGRIVGEVPAARATREQLGVLMTGGRMRGAA